MAQEDISHLGAAACAKAEELSRQVCQGDVGLGMKRQAEPFGLGCCLGEQHPEQWFMAAHSVLGLLPEGPSPGLLEEPLLVG